MLNRGRLLHLVVDGQKKDVWTTAPTVAAALSQLGYTTADFVSMAVSVAGEPAGVDLTDLFVAWLHRTPLPDLP